MRIIAVGGAGTIGRAVVELLSARHDVVVAGRTSGDVRVDISSPESVQRIYEEVGDFDAVVSTAGEAHFGPFDSTTEEELALGVHSKLLGQIRLVLLGRPLISHGGSFTLLSGYIVDDPIPEAVGFAVANGGVEGFVRAAALSSDRGTRVNAVSPGMAQDSAEQFGRLNPGRAPVPMHTIAAAFERSVEGWRTGRRRLATGKDDVGGDRYWVRVLDDPSGNEPWGWQINGHHLAVHVVVVGDIVTTTPHFIGAEPARVPTGPHEGRRLLGPEEDLARDLLAALDDGQRAIAIASDVAPDDILTRADPIADPDLLPTGLGRNDMAGRQQDVLDRLLRRYLDRAPAKYARACFDEAVESGLISFSWSGPLQVGAGHYYCIKTPTFLIEYDNTQDNANHAHSVWRHLLHDWGTDPLREHYAHHHPVP